MKIRPAIDEDLAAAEPAARQQGMDVGDVIVAGASQTHPAKDRAPATRNGVPLLTTLDGGRPVNLALVNQLRDGGV